MATIREVAARAGVSIATVSYALNRPERVNPAQRARVEEAASALDYHPDSAARTLRTRRSHLVSLIVPDVANHFYAAVARGVHDAIKPRGLHVMLGNTDALAEEERYFLRAVSVQRAAGAIIVPFRLDPEALRRACPPGTPVVVGGAPEVSGDLPSVHADDEGGAREAVAYLLSTGRRRIAYIGGIPRTPPTERRHRGYLQAHADAGMTPDPALVVTGDFHRADGESAMERLLAGPAFDAIFAANDLLAIGAIRTARRHGLRIPDEVAIVGLDDIDEAEIVEPPLTTVRQPSYEFGYTAGELLLDLLDGREGVPLHRALPCTLIRRESA
jgi:LacI family transcriptional regulator